VCESVARQLELVQVGLVAVFALDLITALDLDGPGEREDEAAQVNELQVSARTGKVKGQLDGLARELLCTALDALSTPRGAEDDRSAGVPPGGRAGRDLPAGAGLGGSSPVVVGSARA
jgi:hypothetical protein